MSNSAFNNTIPTFIKAPTAEGLRALMLEMNLANKTNYSFYSIYSKGKFHYAWYWISQTDLLKAMAEDIKEEETTTTKVKL